MPVLSPRHSSSLSGSYRSTFSSSLSRPYYGSTYSSPRITTTSYSERYSSKSYTEDGTKKYSRHASISEDIRDSSTFNGSSRSSSLREPSLSDRELSATREPRNYSSTLSMIDSVADLRNKYSPSNYVPAVLRSKSINDIGRPPIEKSHKSSSATATTSSSSSKKVIKMQENVTNTTTSLAFTNHTNKEKLDNLEADDTNGNRTTTSVAEIRKKFDANPGLSFGPIARKVTLQNGHASAADKIKTKLPQHKPELLGGNIKCYKQTLKQEQEQECERECEREQEKQEKPDGIDDSKELPRTHNHTTNFASYIPSKEFFDTTTTTTTTLTKNIESQKNNEHLAEVENEVQTRITTVNNDITTSPRLPRSSISQSSSISNSRSSPSSNNTRASPTNNRASPTANSAALDTLRARSTTTNDDYEQRERERERERERGGTGIARSQGLNGLKNIGNTCFMNSVIQCLSNTKYLLEYVREDGYQSDINTSISSMKGALIKAFSQVIQELWSPDSSDKVVNTVALKSQIQRFAPRFMGYAQQDAQEFLRYLLEGLHEDVNRVKSKPKPILTEIDETLNDAQKASEAWSRYLRMDNSRVVDIFVGQLKSTLRCTHCGHCSVTFDPFWDLSLPIPQRSGQLRLGQCLEHFTREETLDGDEKPTCSKCKERRKCTKSFCIQKFPKILVIHLKRFSPTERFRGKLSLVIDFPLQGLDLSAFAASKSQTESMYNLYAISNHSGTTYSGHYTAYCKHPYSGQWHEYNDSRVSSISSKNVVSSEAYVLFYELINQNSHL